MEGPASVARARARARVLAVASALGVLGPGVAAAQSDPRYAIDRLEPAERGSDWFANESLDLRGRLRPSVGYVISYAHRPLVVASADGSGERAPVKELAFLHVGASLVLVDRVRVAFDMPFQLYAGGESVVARGTLFPAPPRESGLGDLRLGTDVRVFGTYGGPITGALGVQVWAPTGQASQWASDGAFRVRPRAMVSGELGAFVWAAQASVVGRFARESSELNVAAAAGVRLARTVVVGPEIFGSTRLDDAFARSATPVEALLGAHWLIDGTARIGGGLGGGLTDGDGAPSWRAMFTVEWAPEIPSSRRRGARPHGGPGGDHEVVPDRDRDGVPDSLDACPDVAGIKTDDPRTNGCPPDADQDGIDDLADACPTVPGIATSDPATNGCPDRDRDKDGVPNELDACPDEPGAPDIDPRRSGCPRAFVRGSRIEVLDPVEWKPGGAELVASADNEQVLTALLAVLLALPGGRTLRIEGYSDDRGDPVASRQLTAARAAVVAKWLVDHGIDRGRIASAGFGQERPVATNETEAGRSENRRLEFHLEP